MAISRLADGDVAVVVVDQAHLEAGVGRPAVWRFRAPVRWFIVMGVASVWP